MSSRPWKELDRRQRRHLVVIGAVVRLLTTAANVSRGGGRRADGGGQQLRAGSGAPGRRVLAGPGKSLPYVEGARAP
jgi:hypothetical protein